MGDLDQKQKAKKDADNQKRRREDAEDDHGQGDGTNLLPWDADVERFLEKLERALNSFRAAMSSSEFRTLTLEYRERSFAEKRAISNRMQQKGLGALLRALHAGDFRMYLDGWQQEANVARAHGQQRADSDEPG